MNIIMKAWSFLSGKKTATAAVLKVISDIALATGHIEVAAIVDQIGNALLALGLTHKGVKKINQ